MRLALIALLWAGAAHAAMDTVHVWRDTTFISEWPARGDTVYSGIDHGNGRWTYFWLVWRDEGPFWQPYYREFREEP